MAPSRSRTASSHARLHKRGNSASSITSPSALSPLPDSQAFLFNRSETPKVTYEEPWNEPTRLMPTASAATHSIKIKPYLRKLSSREPNSLDLSRPAAENEGLAGLGITDYSPSAADVTFTGLNSRGVRHNRSTSNNSQFSTASSLRPTPPYMPPIRQTPQPYTSPISKSTPPSVLGNEIEADGTIMTDEEYRLRQNAFDPARRSGSISSVPGVAPALRIHTTGSSTLLGGYSQSTASLSSPVGQSRSRGETLKSIDTAASPSSRTSFDKAFGFIRGGRDSPVDPASRAASIRAARQAFLEKEEAKERKYDKEVSKQVERDHRKQYRKEERSRRKSEGFDSPQVPRSRSVSGSNNEAATPRPSIGGRQYSDPRLHHHTTLPAFVQTVDNEKQGVVVPEVTKTRAAKGRWLRFVTWFKTRILRMSNRVHMNS